MVEGNFIELVDCLIRKYHPQLDGQRSYGGEIAREIQSHILSLLESEEMVEVVARSLCIKDGEDPNCFYGDILPDIPHPVWESYTSNTKVALKAISDKIKEG